LPISKKLFPQGARAHSFTKLTIVGFELTTLQFKGPFSYSCSVSLLLPVAPLSCKYAQID